MFDLKRQVPILLEFRGMPAPVVVRVPGYVFRYLDSHAERTLGTDGRVIYRQPSYPTTLPKVRYERREVRAAASLLA